MVRHERLQRLLGGAPLLALRQRLRQRYQRGLEGGITTLGQLNDLERAALCGILGRRLGQGASMRIDIAEIDVALRHGALAESLRDALEILDGPIANLTAQRASAQQRWQSLSANCAEPRLAALIGDARGLGLLKRVAGSDPELAGRLCATAQRVLEKLPATALARSHLAADVLADAHGLDQGRPVATLVLAALRRRSPVEPDSNLETEGDETAREIWAGAGVLVNELARPALFLNLPGSVSGAGPEMAGRSGEPGYLSLRALLRSPPAWDVAGRTVFVCENPNLVAIAADALGVHCAPMVCTDGMPAAAQRTLLLQLRAAGARLLYHGDFDWPGIGIGNVVMRQFGALPWRYQAQDYRAATATAATADWRQLGPASIVAQWDGGLSDEMSACGRAIDEEAVAQMLLQDLNLENACQVR
jgi:uncharacterized protein (TIGR02679 family)